jgi:hypothetical protein
LKGASKKLKGESKKGSVRHEAALALTSFLAIPPNPEASFALLQG